MRAGYRVGQFLQAVRARPEVGDLAQALKHLDPPLFRLFLQMSPDEQAHSLRVLHLLLAEGQDDPDLLAAALLHDVGKSRMGLRLWERVLATLLGPFVQHREKSGRKEASSGWTRALAVASLHPAWGAELIEAAGGSQQLQELVRRHQDPIRRPPATRLESLLHALQQADERS